ncbi:MAG TPA: hypothetical protein VMT62_17950 [Syntrophorhabdaceae bacterium]|nr:hypothetical protein [Syntrophorhabdaceae bacterium]
MTKGLTILLSLAFFLGCATTGEVTKVPDGVEVKGNEIYLNGKPDGAYHVQVSEDGSTIHYRVIDTNSFFPNSKQRVYRVIYAPESHHEKISPWKSSMKSIWQAPRSGQCV